MRGVGLLRGAKHQRNQIGSPNYTLVGSYRGTMGSCTPTMGGGQYTHTFLNLHSTQAFPFLHQLQIHLHSQVFKYQMIKFSLLPTYLPTGSLFLSDHVLIKRQVYATPNVELR